MKLFCALAAAIVLLSLLTVETAAQAIPEDLREALPPETEALLEDAITDDCGGNEWLRSLDVLWQATRREFVSLAGKHAGSAALLLAVVLLCSLADGICRAAKGVGEHYTALAGALVITVITAGSIRSMTDIGLETLEQMDVFSKALLPSLASALAASGGVVSAGIRQVSTVLFTGTLISAIRQLLLPMVYCYIAVSVADAALPEHDLARLRDGIGKTVAAALKILLVAFTLFLTVAGAAGNAADAVALRLTRSAISTAVPVVGSIIADASDSVLASAGLLKSSVGLMGTLGILTICLTPFLQLAVQYLLYKLTALIASIVGPEPLVELIDALGTAFGLLLGMTGTCALLLLISVASSVSVVIK